MPLDDRRLGFVKILRDRTDRHLVDQRLRASEERFRLLAINIPQLVFRSLSDGTRTWPSPQWINFTGLSFDESKGFGWLDAIHPEDLGGTLAGWPVAKQSGEYYVEHRVRRRADGQYRWHQTRARPMRDGAGGDNAEWVGTMTDVHDLRALQERQKVLMAELQHRTRNLLAMTQAIATQTLRKAKSPQAFMREFESRLRALSRVQVLLTGVDYNNVDLRDLLTAELQAHDGLHLESGKVLLDGPALPLPPRPAQALGLALHELVTNAVKYGALAQQSARLAVTWRLEQKMDERRVVLQWKESGVSMSPQAADRRYGYGSELIERALPYQLGAETSLVFESDGVRCTIGVVLKENKDA
jgi:PAS domain S-box-containing protein